MNEKETLVDQMLSSKFAVDFIKVLAPLTSAHMKIFMENDVDYDDIGNDKEKKLKEISNLYGLLQTAVSDLELVLTFLRIENRKAILEIYPTIEAQEKYFKYHLENYIIRVITITDIIGKLGNLIFECGLDDEKCNGYSFKEKMKQVDGNIVTIVEKLLQKTKTIKDKRHKKLHTGKSEIGYFEGIVFYDDLSRLIKTEADPILDDFTDKNIAEEIDRIEVEIREIIDIVIEFTDYANTKFLEIVNR